MGRRKATRILVQVSLFYQASPISIGMHMLSDYFSVVESFYVQEC